MILRHCYIRMDGQIDIVKTISSAFDGDQDIQSDGFGIYLTSLS